MATGTDRFASRQHGWIWDIKRYALHDGPGIRTTVFVKGCPLRCQWCCNPESQSFRPEAAWIGERCLNCGLCEQVCPHGAISHDGGRRYVDHQLCDLCGECARRCPGEALQIMGRRVFVDEVLAEISRDSVFFSRSGGGLTVSGGEPLAQPDFVAEILRRYKTEEKGFSTAVETCGHAEWPMVARVGRYTDLFLFDLKHMDPGEHFRLTGVGNRLILENAARLAESGHTLVIRLPLIPGLNDDEENVRRTAGFALKLGIKRLDLLPYHRLGEPKYTRLERDYALAGTRAYPEDRLSGLRRMVEDLGVSVQVGG